MDFINKIRTSAEFIQNKILEKPEIGVVLGTGLGSLADYIEESVCIDYKDIPNFPVSTVAGHAGRFIFGKLKGKKVLAMQGRFHYYEGYSMQDVTMPIRVMKLLGIENLIISNACGGLNPNFNAGDIMIIKDHINFMGNNPLIGYNLDEFGPRFPDMSNIYSKEFIQKIENIALKKNINIKKGVYAGITGPSYFTKAELKILITLGADSIGMSTVPEAIVARHCNMNVLGISCITDMAIPDTLVPLTHEDVLKVAEKTKPIFVDLVLNFINEV